MDLAERGAGGAVHPLRHFRTVECASDLLEGWELHAQGDRK